MDFLKTMVVLTRGNIGWNLRNLIVDHAGPRSSHPKQIFALDLTPIVKQRPASKMMLELPAAP